MTTKMLPHDVIPWIMICVAMALMAGVLIRRAYRRGGSARRREGHLVRASQIEPRGLREQQDVEARAMACEVRMHETARELCGRIDSKIRVLEHLTGVAERQIQELKKLTERSPKNDDPRP